MYFAPSKVVDPPPPEGISEIPSLKEFSRLCTDGCSPLFLGERPVAIQVEALGWSGANGG